MKEKAKSRLKELTSDEEFLPKKKVEKEFVEKFVAGRRIKNFYERMEDDISMNMALKKA